MSYRRYNPLLDEWVLVAANRVNRPWQGAKERQTKKCEYSTASDYVNPLAPKGIRANGSVTPDYKETFVFQNDFPSVTDDGSSNEIAPFEPDNLFQVQKAKGTCRVICYHPDSNLTMAHMTVEQIEKVIDVWIHQLTDLKEKFEWIQLFENKGEIMGCSNPHPHGQLWATGYLPTEPQKKHINQKASFFLTIQNLRYIEHTKRVMLMDYVEKELERKERIVAENADWVVVVPFWGFWPFETMILPKTHIKSLYDINAEQKKLLATIMKVLLVKYDNLFECSFPYSMGWYNAPTGRYLKEDCSFWTLHAVFYPPLLRSAIVKKFLASYELLCEKQRDITPEKAAEMLRAQSDVLYSVTSSNSTPISS